MSNQPTNLFQTARQLTLTWVKVLYYREWKGLILLRIHDTQLNTRMNIDQVHGLRPNVATTKSRTRKIKAGFNTLLTTDIKQFCAVTEAQ